MLRPHLGRAGAGALVAAAAILMVAAVQTGAGTAAGSRIGPLASRAEAAYMGGGLGPPGVHVRAVLAPIPEARPEPRAVVPVGRDSLHLPILMYHYIRVNPDPSDSLGYGLSVTPADFNAQLDWLAANGYHPVDFNDVRAYFAGRRPLPARPVVLTFDDGYRDFYTTAYPALRAHNFKAVSYVVTGFLGGPNYMTWEMVRELDVNGIEIGAHTFSHIDLTKASPDELHRQLVDSQQTFIAELGHPVVDFCYPAGRFNAQVAAAVQQAGYQTATTTVSGNVHSMGDRFTWSRVRVSGGESIASLAGDLGPSESTVTQPPPATYLRFRDLARLPLSYDVPPPGWPLQELSGLRLLP